MGIRNNGLHRLLPTVLLALAIAGCGAVQKNDVSLSENVQAGAVTSMPTATQEPASNGGGAEADKYEPAATPNPEKHAEVMLYGGNPDFTETVERKAEITYASHEELIQNTMDELQKSVEGQIISLWKDIAIHSVKLDAGRVSIDVGLNDEKRLGAPGELMLIETLKSTLFQFDFVNEIELTQDGEKVESLMGHVDLDDPITRDSQS
ncbi:GerMN domain-containing protein [Paenibacillus sp. HB172176]|uniref:GerMN domain-containing protein n=1 Tax=Paenibacillus sp. HB172176 TaxID=2493690 RepID=UPI0014394B93|nr:GerMN domain-containing protein [Paenibacillus sp. HB172176]